MFVFSVNFNCVDPYVQSFNGDNYSFKVYIINSVHNSLVSLDHLIPCDSRLYNDAREGSFVSLAKICKRYSPPFSQASIGTEFVNVNFVNRWGVLS